MARICDYEGSQYRYDFWESGTRKYEDMVERIAIKAMLPPAGKRMVEVGAGFGRLADMYEGYDQVVLTDYARTQLEEAQKYLGTEAEKYIFVVADVYKLPFNPGAFDALVMVRVMHHLEDVPSALAELKSVVRTGGVAVIEFASKLNLKAILRWLLHRQSWNPFDCNPVEFVDMNIDFHPGWMRRQFEKSGFVIDDIRTVSHFRIPMLKKMIPAKVLSFFDALAQKTGRFWQLTPSVFFKASVSNNRPFSASLFKCPTCGNDHLSEHPRGLWCSQCSSIWEYREGIYDFKKAIKEEL